MRYKIIARSYRRPGNPFLLRLEDGRVVWDTLAWIPRKVTVGETGRIMQGQKGQRAILDAYDAD